MKKLGWIVIVGLAGCFGGGDDDVPVPTGGICGPPSDQCDRIVTDQTQCPTAEQICQADECTTEECCWCDPGGFWWLASTECFDGCTGIDAPEQLLDGPGVLDAPFPIDAPFPPPDGCQPGDAPAGSALPHC